MIYEAEFIYGKSRELKPLLLDFNKICDVADYGHFEEEKEQCTVQTKGGSLIVVNALFDSFLNDWKTHLGSIGVDVKVLLESHCYLIKRSEIDHEDEDKEINDLNWVKVALDLRQVAIATSPTTNSLREYTMIQRVDGSSAFTVSTKLPKFKKRWQGVLNF